MCIRQGAFEESNVDGCDFESFYAESFDLLMVPKGSETRTGESGERKKYLPGPDSRNFVVRDDALKKYEFL